MRIHGCVLLMRAVHIGRYVSMTGRVRARAYSGTAPKHVAERHGGMSAWGTETSAAAGRLRTGGMAEEFGNEKGTGPEMPAVAAFSTIGLI